MKFLDHRSRDILIREMQEDAYCLRQVHRSGLEAQLVVDIGSNTGIISVQSRFLWPSASIYAVEPTPRLIPLLHDNVENLNVQILHAALGHPGAVTVTDTGSSVEWCTQSTNSESSDVSVMSVPLPLLLAATGVPDVLCIDCEGGEVGLMYSGVLEILKKVKYIVIEVHKLLLSEQEVGTIFSMFRQLHYEGNHIVKCLHYTVDGESALSIIKAAHPDVSPWKREEQKRDVYP